MLVFRGVVGGEFAHVGRFPPPRIGVWDPLLNDNDYG